MGNEKSASLGKKNAHSASSEELYSPESFPWGPTMEEKKIFSKTLRGWGGGEWFSNIFEGPI